MKATITTPNGELNTHTIVLSQIINRTGIGFHGLSWLEERTSEEIKCMCTTNVYKCKAATSTSSGYLLKMVVGPGGHLDGNATNYSIIVIPIATRKI